MSKVGGYIKGLTIASVFAMAGLATTAIAEEKGGEASAMEQGKEIAFETRKGNCLACHSIAGGEEAGNIGPPLIAMKARFPDREVLRAQIWDATVKNPATSMPPFGLHQILSEKEIDMVTDFIHTL